MHQTLPFLLAIVVLIVLVNLLATKLKIAYPILLVLAGILISMIPSVPKIKVNPDWIFFIVLPPLLFEASWTISYKGLVRFRRIIGSFAFLVVFFTASAVAFFTHKYIPGFTLSLGFLLGAIVSPPDAVSAGAILKFIKIPKSTSTVLEGESLFNDASSLIVFQFALIAVSTGNFIWGNAITSFLWMVGGGVVVGILLAFIFVQALKRLPTNAPSDIAFTLVAPYLFYWVAEQMGCSGVMAVVSGGLFMSNRRLIFLTSESRVRGYSFWESFVFILNGLVFFIIGLDLTEVVTGLTSSGTSVQTGIFYGTIVTGFIILIRIISSYIALFSTYLFRRKMLPTTFKFSTSMNIPLILGWTGMRGVVTLAAALSIPVYLDNGTLFPQRDLILFISFMVIILTLFVQGLTLPFILKRFPLQHLAPELKSEKEQHQDLRKELHLFTIQFIREKYKNNLKEDLFLAKKLEQWQDKLDEATEELYHSNRKELYLELLEAQRNFLIEKNKDFKTDEDLIRHQMFMIDLEEERLKAV
ncbi:MAG: Na+/H+ antiporter [Bacteroidetes bacterium]|nr:Na+/H+ antiporter [Bacteroidota bacterium]